MKLRSFSRMLRMSVCMAAQDAQRRPPYPHRCKLPSTQGLIKQLRATGVQIYQCQPTKERSFSIRMGLQASPKPRC